MAAAWDEYEAALRVAPTCHRSENGSKCPLGVQKSIMEEVSVACDASTSGDG